MGRLPAEEQLEFAGQLTISMLEGVWYPTSYRLSYCRRVLLCSIAPYSQGSAIRVRAGLPQYRKEHAAMPTICPPGLVSPGGAQSLAVDLRQWAGFSDGLVAARWRLPRSP